MAIKVTLGDKPQQESKPFPKLMKHDDGTIALFSSEGVGTYIYDPSTNCNIMGAYCKDISTKSFTDYNEPITLQNA